MTSVYDNLGPACTVADFAEDELTPELEYYADKDDDGFEGTPDDILLMSGSTGLCIMNK